VKFLPKILKKRRKIPKSIIEMKKEILKEGLIKSEGRMKLKK